MFWPKKIKIIISFGQETLLLFLFFFLLFLILLFLVYNRAEAELEQCKQGNERPSGVERRQKDPILKVY